ncbi:hypothetical protein BpHYR1_014331 [Brachionus plicatilis]|uniref:Uncharacterized protein n=1 Tax=Brachionus plicatilis TaxID=10195 RepID=A0A3M7Q6P1_BRAPC|nr:hypothetical protein BpHYR1_014331 [Brachionus plicatilis]
MLRAISYLKLNSLSFKKSIYSDLVDLMGRIGKICEIDESMFPRVKHLKLKISTVFLNTKQKFNQNPWYEKLIKRTTFFSYLINLNPKLIKLNPINALKQLKYLANRFLPQNKKIIDCLQCFECDSRKIGQNCLTNPPPSRKCLDKHSLYCVAMKHYDKHGNITGVIRACSKVNFGLKCRLAQSEHEPYKTCFNTCWEDACNRSTFPLLSSRLLALKEKRASFIMSPSVFFIYGCHGNRSRN